MARTTRPKPVTVDARHEAPASVATIASADSYSLDLGAALDGFAEELGRLLARRELARLSRRRGYSFVEQLFGIATAALTWLLLGRALGGFLR